MKYVFDIDGTICTQAAPHYEKAQSYPERIKKINTLYDAGHTIICFTARGMGRHNNNPVRAVQDFYSMTEVRLRQWGAKYHELILGKPAADVYIDDKGIEANEFFNK